MIFPEILWVLMAEQDDHCSRYGHPLAMLKWPKLHDIFQIFFFFIMSRNRMPSKGMKRRFHVFFLYFSVFFIFYFISFLMSCSKKMWDPFFSRQTHSIVSSHSKRLREWDCESSKMGFNELSLNADIDLLENLMGPLSLCKSIISPNIELLMVIIFEDFKF